MTKPLTIALNRGGRILEECLAILAETGIEPTVHPGRSRKLVFENPSADVRLVVVRGDDVPVHVEYGAADLGITGKDTLLEYGDAEFYERLDLEIARCRIMTAAPPGWRPGHGRLRVATKLVNVTRRYLAEQGHQAEIIRLSGALEIAPQLGLADMIVDLVETGHTLEANGLEPRETIAESSARLIVNRASMKMRFERIEALIEAMRAAVAARRSAGDAKAIERKGRRAGGREKGMRKGMRERRANG